MLKPTSIAFSGGRTSGYMLRRHLDARGGSLPANHAVLFCNTGKERDETLDFVHECETRWGVPIVWLEYTQASVPELDERAAASNEFVRKAWEKSKKVVRPKYAARGIDFDAMLYHDWKIVDYATAHRNGQPDSPFDKLIRWMSVLPNVRARACTAQMKIRTMDRYLCSIGYHERFELIGIRGDEWERTIEIKGSAPKRISPQFPLVDLDVTEADVLDFWEAQPFDLQLHSYEGNCDLCFLKSRAKIERIMRERPESAEWWIEKEREKEATCKSGARFRKDRPSYATILSQVHDPRLFDDADTEDIPCSCSEGGYRFMDENDELLDFGGDAA